MSKTLQQHINDYVQEVFGKYPGAWLVWCDPRGDWSLLLQRVATAPGTKGFRMISVTEQTAGEPGSPLWRRKLQELIDANESFLLHVTAPEGNLGWLWAQALLAEKIQALSLREQLLKWGWRPQNIKTSDDDLARLARQNLHLNPAEWGGGKILPEPMRLLDILSGGTLQQPGDEFQDEDALRDERMILDLTVEEAGLLPINEQHIDRWRLDALARLLVTQAQSVAPQFLAQHDYLVAPEKRKFALDLFDKWLDSVKLSKGLPDRILEADRILGLGSYFSDAPLISGTYLSQAAERALFASACSHLGTLSGRDLLDALAPLHEVCEQHAQAFWGDKHGAKPHPQSIPWGELARLSKAVQILLNAAPGRVWANPDEAVNWYVQTGWQVEQAGEEIMRQLSKPTTELLNLITHLREAYSNHWETYMLQWSDIWSYTGCPLPPYESQGKWLKEQLKTASPTAIIFVDALRYDIGVALKEQVNRRQGAERAEVFPARTALPTITAIGMGVALPIDESELRAELANGKWQLYQQGQNLNLSLAENRREWLKTFLKAAPDALLAIDKKGSTPIPAAQGKYARLFLFDATIDKLGHDEELEPLGTQDIQERYVNTIEQLRDKGWIRILIVTDHGFILWPGTSEHRVPLPVPDPTFSSRRALAYPANALFEGPQGLAPGGLWRIAVPSGAACFRTYGGLGYFHGGASLQEWLVPCIKIEWPSTAKPVGISIQPVAQILSLRHRIILEVQHENLFTNDNALPREVEILVRDARQKTILFRSERKIITPNQDEAPVIIEPIEGAEAPRNTKMIIELRDARTNVVIDTQTTTLMVDLENW